jgi:hypothetical protein
MKFFEFVLGLFKRRKIGPLSVSPVGLAVFGLIVAAAVVISKGVFEDKEIQSHIYAALNYARPVAEQARLMQEKTGKWPALLAEVEAAKAKPPPQIARMELRKDGEVLVVFASPPPLANSTLILKVIVRGSEHLLECQAEGNFKGALPSVCRPGEGPQRISWPPESAK